MRPGREPGPERRRGPELPGRESAPEASTGAGAAGAGAAAGAAPAAPTTPSVPPTWTTASSPTVISSSVPATGDGISVSTLSVETSTSGSSTATESPTAFSQRVTVPSVTLSPRAGSTTGVPAPAGAAAGAGAAGAAGASTTGAATGSATGAATGSSTGAGAAGASAGAAAPASSAAPMTPSSPPTATTSSSPAVIASSTPEAGAGISVSTLSVDTSTSGSSAWTVSPTCLSQRVTVPSVTLSPSWGNVTETDMACVTPSVRGRSGGAAARQILARGPGCVRSVREEACRQGPGRPRRTPRSGWGARARGRRRPRGRPPS